MADGPLNRVIKDIRRATLQPEGGNVSDGQLLESFLTNRDEAAFAALVNRHGPMVMGVCRRVVHDLHDAEDAFQATFLVLVRKAASIGRRELLGNWLYGVAYRTAMKARTLKAKRAGKTTEAVSMARQEATEDRTWQDLQIVLDQELSRMPDKYRKPVVLCHLEGKTKKEAARLLGCPEGTVSGRLARAREMLAKRLARHGLALTGGALGLALSQDAVVAAVPSTLATSTVKAASLGAQSLASGAISANVAGLVQGVMTSMLLSQLKTVMAVFLVGLCAIGTVLGVHLVSASGKHNAKQEASAKSGSDPSPQREERSAQTQAQFALQKSITLEAGFDRNTPLKEALGYLSEVWKIKIEVDEKSFADVLSIKEPQWQPITLPKLTNVQKGTVLRLLADQSNGRFLISKEGTLVLVPDDGKLIAAKIGNEGYKRHVSSPAKIELQEKLSHHVTNVITFEKALNFLASSYDLNVVLDSAAFIKQRNKDIRRYPVQMPNANTMKLHEALKMLCDQAEATYLFDDNVIIIVPDKSKKP